MNDEWCIIYVWFMSYLFMNDDEFINYYLLKQNEDIDLLNILLGTGICSISSLM